ncbi:MAG: glycosyltransferase family 4 protein, partial [Acidobacteriales bacterium]|nr:glycosyltransferase family 4 protein [Terriglobales bacterium]
VGSANPASYPGVTMRRARLATEAPLKRILWEQVIQPFELGDYDLYHAMAFVAPLLLTKPMVATVYDLTFMRYPERLTAARRLYLRLLTGLTCQRARRITAISHSTKRDLVDLLGVEADKIDVTPLGYERELFKPLPAKVVDSFRQKQGLPERFWLFLGTLEPRKNLVTLVEAYSRLPASERLPLVLAGGKGWMTEPLFEAIERLQLTAAIRFPGFIPAEEMALWYNSAEAFLYPSVFEGFGLPVLEAMACGTPVITSNVSSLPEVAEGAGLCLPPHDIGVWTEALHRVYHDTMWREQARACGLQKAQQFDWLTTTRLTVASYKRALNQ